jgi:hypothetical protein
MQRLGDRLAPDDAVPPLCWTAQNAASAAFRSCSGVESTESRAAATLVLTETKPLSASA